MKKARFVSAVIRSQRRYTYEQAYALLDLKGKKTKQPDSPKEKQLADHLNRAWELAAILRKGRFKAGGLDLDFPEVRAVLNKKGEAIDVKRVENDESHQLIEEFIQALGIYPTGTLVELNNGAVALIHAQNVRNRIQPEILLVLDKNKRPVEKLTKVDMREYNERHEFPLSIARALTAGEFGLDPNEIMQQHHSQRWDWRKLAFN